MMRHTKDYESIEHVVSFDSDHVRVYQLHYSNDSSVFVAWRNPLGVLFPEDGEPMTQVLLDLGNGVVSASRELLATSDDAPVRVPLVLEDGIATLELAHSPVYIVPEIA